MEGIRFFFAPASRAKAPPQGFKPQNILNTRKGRFVQDCQYAGAALAPAYLTTCFVARAIAERGEGVHFVITERFSWVKNPIA